MTDDQRALLPVHAEMQDASENVTDTRAAPLATTIELAKLLTRFETQIADDDRHFLITLGGSLLRLDRELNDKPAD